MSKLPSKADRRAFRGLAAVVSVFMLAVGTSLAQSNAVKKTEPSSYRLKGQVTGESGEPVPGAGVVITGTRDGTLTDIDGLFSINVPGKDAVLEVSVLGYESQKVAVAGRTYIVVSLKEASTALEESVVVGYGTQKRKYLVGAVSQVSSKELLKAPMTNISNMVAGKLPGITAIQRSGQPGSDQSSLLVRGVSTFNSSAPLVIVDGIPNAMDRLNPNDVESVTVLKDAATSAIYGVRGANGVILVTTKSGREGTSSISYDGSVTFSTNTAMPELLNAKDYIGWHNKAREMDGLTPYWTPEIIARMKEKGIYGETDWMKLLFKDYGFTHQHNLSATGGNDRVRYYASLGMMSQEGIIPNTSYNRYNFRVNIDARIAKGFRFNMNVSGLYGQREAPGYNIGTQTDFSPISAAIYALPIIAPENRGLPQGYQASYYVHQPVAAVNQSGYQKTRGYEFHGLGKLEYDFGSITDVLKGLRMQIFGSYDYSNSTDRNFLHSYKLLAFSPTTDPDAVDVIETTASGIYTTSNFNRSASDWYGATVRAQADYSREFGKHNVSALLMYEQTHSYSETMTGYKNGYYATTPVDLSIGNSWEGISVPVSGSYSDSAMASFAGRFSYGYDAKYLAEFTFREDGSYKFDPDNRWGFFPSVGLGWVVSRENFFKNALPVVDYLKLRASYGELGMDDTSPYLYMQSYSTTAPGYAYMIGGVGRTAYYTTNYVYKDLTWSRTHSYNVGFDLNMFKDKLSVEFDWFYKLTDKILEGVGSSYSPSLGGNVPSFDNSGKMDNRGLEVVVKHRNHFASGWGYSLTGSFSWARNKLLSIKHADDHPYYRKSLGQPLGYHYGFKAIGLYQTQEQLDNSPTPPSGSKRLGDLMYADINGDGKIDSQGDYVRIARSYTPEISYSLNMEVNYKNLYLTALWQGVAICSYQLSAAYGTGVKDNTMYTRPFYNEGNAPYYLVEGAWREDHRNAKYPRLSTVANGNNAWPSSWWVKNGSYLRLKTLQIGYNFSPRLLSKAGISRLNVYVSGTNLLTFSAFKYVDPEMPSVNNGYYPQQRTFSLGLNITI